MKRSLSAAAIAMTCMVALGTTAAHADLLDDIMKAKKIRIATDLAIPLRLASAAFSSSRIACSSR